MDDFAAVSAAAVPTLFDAGNDVAQPQFAAVWSALTRLNEWIAVQNEKTSNTALQTITSRAWVTQHANKPHYLAPHARSIGASAWDASNATDGDLLSLLTRYCYRCHGTVRYTAHRRSPASCHR